VANSSRFSDARLRGGMRALDMADSWPRSSWISNSDVLRGGRLPFLGGGLF